MSYVIGTRFKAADRAAAIAMVNEIGVPKLTAQGATSARLLERISGDSPGLFSVMSVWDTLHAGIVGVGALNEDPEALAALEENPVEPHSRALGIVHAQLGETGAFQGQVLMSVTNPDPERAAAFGALTMEIGRPLGIKGVWVITMFSAGAASGMMAGAVEMDDVDAWPNVVMAGGQDPRVSEFVESVGASPVERTLFKVH